VPIGRAVQVGIHLSNLLDVLRPSANNVDNRQAALAEEELATKMLMHMAER
jgi:hypothetical protein